MRGISGQGMRRERREGRKPVAMPGIRHKLTRSDLGSRARLLTCLLVPWAIAAGGCGFWDELRSNDYSFSATIHPPPPLEVLTSNTTDGWKRAKALGRLQEPAQNKGSEREQELALLYLSRAAREDEQAICRLEAIKTLATYKDPRAIPPIIDAYYRADGFRPDDRTVIRMQALTAMGTIAKDDPKALECLVSVVQAPPVDSGKSNEDTKQQTLRERLTAVRALGHFKNYRATEALVQVLRAERDVALHDAAHQSLVAVTGKKLPADAKAWDDLLNNPAAPQDRAIARDDGNKVKLMQPIIRTGLTDKDKPRQ